jgi:hypothetical protein
VLEIDTITKDLTLNYLFFSLKKARQIPQFMPQEAIREKIFMV